jgi:predicted transposase YbfD/YdcC
VASLQIPAEGAGKFVRGHWDIENSTYWVFDMVLRDDECRVKTYHAPADFNTIKHLTLNLLRMALGKIVVMNALLFLLISAVISSQ